MIEKGNVAKISQYYTETRRDYYYLLRQSRHWGMHFGYYITGKEKIHEASLNLNKVLAKKAKIKRNDRVFDAGCGVGGSLIWLVKNRGVTGVGISITPVDISRAKQIAEKENISDRAVFAVGDYRETQLPSNSFDVVWAIESVCHAEDKGDFIKEAYRLLKSGGRLAVADGFLSSDELSQTQKDEVQKWISGWAVPNLASMGSFEEDLRKAGFKSIRLEDKTKNVMKFSRFLYLAGKTIAPPISRLLVAFGKRTKVGAGNVSAAVGQYKTLKKGYWKYCMVTAEK